MLGKAGASLQVLVVEDSPGDVRLTREAFREANPAVDLHVAFDGVEAMAFLLRKGVHEAAPRLDQFDALVKSINDFWLTRVKLTNQA